MRKKRPQPRSFFFTFVVNIFQTLKICLFIFVKKIKIYNMRKGLFILSISLFVASNAMGANGFIPKQRFNTVTSHNDVYPYILNNAQPTTNKKTNTTGAVSSSLIGKRNVSKRKTSARAATSNNMMTTMAPESAERRVVQRPNTNRAAIRTNNNTTRSTPNVSTRPVANTVRARTQTNKRNATTPATNTNTTQVSSQRCFSDYKECMEGYCRREDTAYNRCYCSAKLAQIDAKYQNKIDGLIQQIIELKYKTNKTSNETVDENIKEYWDSVVGSYTGDNPWVNIDNALNIEWADMQSRIRGQNAFNSGHEYCVQHLRACYYMAPNMRDAYKSEIARDCAAYEKGLQKIQEAAESVIESLK